MIKQSTKGFTLIEIMIALALIAMIGGMLYMSLSQSRKVVATIERITSIQMRAIIAQRQLMRDISGAFIPLSTLEPKKEKKEESPEQNKKEKEEKKDPAEHIAELKKQLTHTFNGTVDNDQFKQLLLITNNPLEVYWSSSAGRPKPRTENVTYVLEPEKTTRADAPAYTLKRIISYKKGEIDAPITQANELITGIKKMTVSYTVLIEEQNEEKQEAPQKNVGKDSSDEKKEEKKIEVQKFDDWNVQTMEDKDVRLQKKLPDYVTLTIELWSPTKDTSEAFAFIVPIAWQEIKHTQKQPSYNVPSVKKDGAQKTNPQKTGAQTPHSMAGKK